MMGFMSGVSDAFDAVSRNVLPFFEVVTDAQTQRVENQAAVEVARAQASATSTTNISKAKIAWGVGLAASALLLLVVFKRKR